MEPSRWTSVGIIGLGIIGSRVSSLLRREGYSVYVWNRSPRAEPNFLPSAREVAQSSDIIGLFVRDGEALLEVIRSMGTALGESHIVMNHATVGPRETLEAERLVKERGAAFLDAPFTGSRDAAAEGMLVYYVGGEESVLGRALPILKVSAKAILQTGPVGSATYLKIATNMISAAEVGILAEALALLDRGGIPLARLQEALEHNVAASGLISAKLPLMLTGDFAPRFSVKNMFKDLQIALRSVEGKGIDLPVTAAAAGSLMGAMQAGWGEDDFSSLARHYSYAGSVKDLPEPGGAATSLPAKEPRGERTSPGGEKATSSAKTPSTPQLPATLAKKVFGLFGGPKNS
jgi:3-hydroxyisobutyrate dehydrogenase-like beta-hydroxyacid dehydrogenase